MLDAEDLAEAGLEGEGGEELEAVMGAEDGVDEIGVVCENNGEVRSVR